MTRTFHIRTFGCQMNEHDTERLAGLLAAEGMERTEDAETADLVILNTCCIRENADNKLYGHLGHLKSLKARRPGMQIAVGGCLAQKDRDHMRDRAPQVDVVFGTHNLANAPELLRRSLLEGPLVEVLDEPIAGGDPAHASALSADRDLPWSAWVTIQTGCDNSCAFCIVPSVRGREVSRSLDELTHEVRSLSGAGVSEITLLGQNVNSYGRDLTKRGPLFASLLRAVGSVEGIERIRFTSPHPKDLRPETVEAMAGTPAVCEHLHLPLQSGSNSVLKAMRRGYTAERYLEKLALARDAIPDLAVTTDLIVGFPGETEDDAERTLEVAAQAEYDSAYTFIFSPRPGTRAAVMKDRFVPPEVIAERFDKLKVVLERSALQKHQARVGRIEEVLVEGTSKRDQATISGRTRQGKLVHFPVPEGKRPTAGGYATVLVTDAAPHFLRGELVDLLAPSRHKVRIPVRSISVPDRGVTAAVT
ncbi:MAG: tRNA (N6-isopentenyl adenosine(37)-C2)-methylthiotransferase MiaB [Acidimicrobiales bacterium]